MRFGVAMERLIAVMWDGNAPTPAVRQVQDAVSGPRRNLAACEAPASLISTRRGGYQIHLAPDQLDLLKFPGKRPFLVGDPCPQWKIRGLPIFRCGECVRDFQVPVGRLVAHLGPVRVMPGGGLWTDQRAETRRRSAPGWRRRGMSSAGHDWEDQFSVNSERKKIAPSRSGASPVPWFMPGMGS